MKGPPNFIFEKDNYEINFYSLVNPSKKLLHGEDQQEFNPEISSVFYINNGGLLRIFSDSEKDIEDILKISKDYWKNFKFFNGNTNEDDLKQTIIFDEDAGGSTIEINGITKKDAVAFIKIIYGPLVKYGGWEIN
jgi:hypothetical protein